jgi:glycosyltransferase involved in cell wall biosynthesis
LDPTLINWSSIKNEAPILSVVMPIYNAELYLDEAINSILAQTISNFEIILVDDGSTDASTSICEKFAELDYRIRHIRKKNEGIATALNVGIAVAVGEFIARMDADDIALPNRFEKQLSFFEKNPNVDVVSASFQPFSITDSITSSIVEHPVHHKIIVLLLCFCCPICHPLVMARHHVFRDFIYKKNISAEDHELWCRVSAKYIIMNQAEVLLKYRRHANSITGKGINKIRLSTYFSGFKNLLRQAPIIATCSFEELEEAEKTYLCINWRVAKFYLILAKLLVFTENIFLRQK